MPNCSFCKQSGHNIRSCTDPRIWQLWQSLVVTFLIPKIGSVFTMQDHWTILGFLSLEYPEEIVRAVSIRYTHKNYGTANYVQHHYRNDLFNYMMSQLDIVSRMTSDMRDDWISMFTQVAQETQIEDPDIVDQDIVTWFEDRTPTPIEVVPSYPIVEAMMLCLETQSELQELVECVICQQEKPVIGFNTTNCGHSYCHDCSIKHIASKGKERAPCPLCRTLITSLSIKDVDNFDDIDHIFGRTACILKDCLRRVFPDSNTNSYMMWTHIDLINHITDELDSIHSQQHLSHLVYSKNTDLERAEALWRYLWTRGIGEQQPDIDFDNFY